MLISAEQYTCLRSGWTISPLTLRNSRTLTSLPFYMPRSNHVIQMPTVLLTPEFVATLMAAQVPRADVLYPFPYKCLSMEDPIVRKSHKVNISLLPPDTLR
jgi:hypothetical protein